MDLPVDAQTHWLKFTGPIALDPLGRHDLTRQCSEARTVTCFDYLGGQLRWPANER